MKPTFARALWSGLATILTLVATARAAEAQCRICGLYNDDVKLCVETTNDGYFECTSNPEYCVGVLPKCFGSAFLLDGSGQDPDFALPEGTEPELEFSLALWSDPRGDPQSRDVEVLRRACDGAVIARRYEAHIAQQLREQTRSLTI